MNSVNETFMFFPNKDMGQKFTLVNYIVALTMLGKMTALQVTARHEKEV